MAPLYLFLPRDRPRRMGTARYAEAGHKPPIGKAVPVTRYRLLIFQYFKYSNKSRKSRR